MTTEMQEVLLKTKEYLDYIQQHYDNVQKSWLIIKNKCQDKSFPFIYDDFKFFTLQREIELHDISKLSKEEFVPYRKKFYPTNFEASHQKEIIESEFRLAWEHHKQNNNHHWENWSTLGENLIAELYVVHNVCDWMAMAMQKGGTAKEYYEKNKDKIIIPSWSKDFMYEIFKYL